MRKMAVTVAAIAAVLGATGAAAQKSKWFVILGIPDIAVLATEAKGPLEARTVTTFIMLPQAAGGIDNSMSNWTVNCKAKTAIDHGGKAYLGAAPAGDLPSSTDGAAASYESDDESVALLKVVAAYACEGTRITQDAPPLADDAAARTYGNGLFGH